VNLKHKSVLLKEVVGLLNIRNGGRFVDATCGLGGHLSEIWKNLKGKGEVLCIDLDEMCVEYILKNFSEKGIYIEKGNYKDIDKFLKKLKWDYINGILFDLGVGSHQIDNEKRGFSFRFNSPLDMRYSKDISLTAQYILNNFSEDELINIFKKLGEEFMAKKIAKEIVKNRPINTTKELVSIVERIKKRRGRIHPATKVFQSLRIFVNREIENLREGLEKSFKLLKEKGRIAVISYHSIEDRIVKKFFEEKVKEGVAKKINKKVIVPKREEVVRNRRSRSAKLRVLEKL